MASAIRHPQYLHFFSVEIITDTRAVLGNNTERARAPITQFPCGNILQNSLRRSQPGH